MRSDTATASVRTNARQLGELLAALGRDLIERETPLRLAVLAALAGEHLLLLGPPGTAKSEIARRLRFAFHDAQFFERLLTRFSVPEELFGPLSIKELEQDRYHRQTERYLPTAHVAFIDEIFKANSAILNSLLTLLNEREFDNGVERVRTPLLSVVGASNELPEGGELAALYDRFLLRFQVMPTSKDGFGRMLRLHERGWEQPAAALRLDPGTLAAVQASAREVEVPEDVLEMLQALRSHLQDKQIYVSDRRWRKALKLLKVSAVTNGRKEVSVWDAWLLQHCTWSRPEEREVVFEWYRERVGTADPVEPQRFRVILAGYRSRLESEQSNRSQGRDQNGKLLWMNADGKPSSVGGKRQKRRGNEVLYLAPIDSWNAKGDRTNNGHGYTEKELRAQFFPEYYSRPVADEYVADRKNALTEKCPPWLEATRYSRAHINGRLDEVKHFADEVARHARILRARRDEVDADVKNHLWLDSGFAAVATRALDEQLGELGKLAREVAELQEGFAALPCSEA